MVHVLNTLLGVSIGVSVFMLGYWGVGLTRLIAYLRAPNAADGLDLPASSDHPCIIVPAHNESANIGSLIASMRAQNHEAFNVVLVLDRCTDDTLERAREAIGDDERFEIFELDDCPPGWAGKVNAIREGVARSSAASTCDVLLFIDADVELDPRCLRAVLALRKERNLDLLSLLPNVTVKRWWEWVVQPAAGLELLRQYPLGRSNRTGFERPFVNGQFLLIERSAYQRIGGHDGVFDEMLEDLAIGRLAAGAGLRCGAFAAGGMVVCRMYATWEAFVAGWSRIFVEAARRRVGRLGRARLQVRAFGVVLPVATIVGLVLAWASIGVVHWALIAVAAAFASTAAIVFLATVGGAFRASGLPWRSILAYPIGAWIVGGILLLALGKVVRRESTRWGGREYQLAPR